MNNRNVAIMAGGFIPPENIFKEICQIALEFVTFGFGYDKGDGYL